MKRKYKIKTYLHNNIGNWLNNIQNVDIPPIYNIYAVQMRKWYGWITIKEFDDYDDWTARSRALNLLDELNKETL